MFSKHWDFWYQCALWKDRTHVNCSFLEDGQISDLLLSQSQCGVLESNLRHSLKIYLNGNIRSKSMRSFSRPQIYLASIHFRSQKEQENRDQSCRDICRSVCPWLIHGFLPPAPLILVGCHLPCISPDSGEGAGSRWESLDSSTPHLPTPPSESWAEKALLTWGYSEVLLLLPMAR